MAETPLLGQPDGHSGEVPEQLDPSLRKVWGELQDIRAANAKMVQKLSQHGVGLDPVSLMQTRLSALIDILFDGTTAEGQAKMLGLEQKFEEAMNDVLKNATANVVKAQLAQGTNMPPEMLRQMAEASGMVAPSQKRKGG